MENYFFLSIGYWNVVGSIVLYLMLNQSIADKVMREWTWTFTQVHEIGEQGSLWLWWAATTNMFLGIINIFATGWESDSQAIVLWSDLFVYGMFLPPILIAVRNSGSGKAKYGKGNYFHLLLICFWLLWTIYVLMSLW